MKIYQAKISINSYKETIVIAKKTLKVPFLSKNSTF